MIPHMYQFSWACVGYHSMGFQENWYICGITNYFQIQQINYDFLCQWARASFEEGLQSNCNSFNLCNKNSEVIIASKQYQHFVDSAHPNHYMTFTEDDPYGAKKRKKLEELKYQVNVKKNNIAAENRIATLSYQW